MGVRHKVARIPNRSVRRLCNGSLLWLLGAILVQQRDRLASTLCPPTLLAGVGWFAMGAAVVVLLVTMRRWTDRRPGLVIDEHGFTDLLFGITRHPIRWSEVSAIESTLTSRGSFLVIKLHDPEAYMDRGHSLRQLMSHRYYENYGTPICLGTWGLQITYPELETLFFDAYREYTENRGDLVRENATPARILPTFCP